MSADELMINVPIVEKALEIFSTLTVIRPEKSFSFILTEEGLEAIQEAGKLAEWGIGGNKPKLKIAALECLALIGSGEPGDPVNVNFTEYELKSCAEILSVIERALTNHEDGLLKK
ncbi:MAG: hypothetical protein ABFS17_13040 [Chloroflexota bacterium]